MLGWGIHIYRQFPDTPTVEIPPDEMLIAHWRVGMDGLEWLNELVRQRKAVDLGGNGYPCRYVASAGTTLPRIAKGPPAHDSPPVIGDDYALPRGWSGEMKINRETMSQCSPDELLIVVAWDQS